MAGSMARTEADGAGVAGMSLGRSRGASGIKRVDYFCLGVVALPVVHGVLPNSLFDGIFQPAGLEQRRSVWNAGNRLVGFEHHLRHADVQLLAGLQVQTQSAQHDGNQPAGARTNNQVEMIAGLWDFMSARCAAFDVDKCAVHEFLDDDEHGVTTNASSVCASWALANLFDDMTIKDNEGGHTERQNAQRRPFGGVRPPDSVRVHHC